MNGSRNKNFCRLPFSHLAIEGQGDVKGCCLTPAFKDNQGGNFNLNKRSLLEIKECKDYLEFQDSFRQGKRHPYCEECWHADDNGMKSLRVKFSSMLERMGFENKDEELIFLEIKMGITCNLRCGICNPVNSSKWAKLHIERNDIRKSESEEMLRLSNWVEMDRFYMPENFSKVRLFHIMGGEPLLIKENERLLDLIIEHGKPEETTIWYNTNGTIFPGKVLEKLKKFKRVQFSLSIDDVGRRFEYQRFPGKWDTVKRNFDKFSEIVSDQIQVELDVCWNLLNTFYIKEIIDELDPVDTQLFGHVSRKLPNGRHHYSGKSLALDSMSADQRKKYIAKIQDAKNFLPNDYAPLIDELSRTIEAKPVNEENILLRNERIELLSSSQKMPFSEYFPELSEVLEIS